MQKSILVHCIEKGRKVLWSLPNLPTWDHIPQVSWDQG